jgi:DNA-directed RNA polymerase specialized sigma24 family protein
MEWVTTTIILEHLRDGRDAAWLAFCERFRSPIAALAIKVGVARAAAEDVAQETLLTFLTGLRAGHYERGKGRLGAWLFGIARMKAMQAREAAARRERVVAAPDDSQGLAALPDAREVAEFWEKSWAANLAEQCMARASVEFDARTFAAFRAVVLEGRAPAEAADRLSMTPNAVHIAKHRVLKRMRALKDELEALV